jgi:hypothetical protein
MINANTTAATTTLIGCKSKADWRKDVTMAITHSVEVSFPHWMLKRLQEDIFIHNTIL